MNNNKCLLQTVSSMRRKSTKQSATIWTRHLPNLLDIKKDRNKKLPQSPLLPKKKKENTKFSSPNPLQLVIHFFLDRGSPDRVSVFSPDRPPTTLFCHDPLFLYTVNNLFSLA